MLPAAHPVRLAGQLALRGLQAPWRAAPRIVDLGCGDATHLSALCASLPDARGTGVDLDAGGLSSARPLPNLHLVRADATTWGDRGSADLVIMHGVLSWVPPAVADALLDRVAHLLVPGGVAVLGVALPARNPSRQRFVDLVRAASPSGSDDDLVRTARDVAVDLYASQGRLGGPGAHELLREAMRASAASDGVLRHEILADHLHPLAHDVLNQRLRHRGLAVLADLRRPLEHLDPTVQAQHDAEAGRSFRLLAVVAGSPAPTRTLPPAMPLRLATGVRLERDGLHGPDGVLGSDLPGVRRWMERLDAAPTATGDPTILATAPAAARSSLLQALASHATVLLDAGWATLEPEPLFVARHPPDTPAAWWLTRETARQGSAITLDLHEVPVHGEDRDVLLAARHGHVQGTPEQLASLSRKGLLLDGTRCDPRLLRDPRG